MRFNYMGPFSGVTLQINGKPTEVLLHPGKPVELPETNDYVQTLIALGHLTSIAPHDLPVEARRAVPLQSPSEPAAATKKGAK